MDRNTLQAAQTYIQQQGFLQNLEQFGVKTIYAEELEQGDQIGIGSYGDVYKGIYKSIEVAIKRFKQSNNQNLNQRINEFFNDITPWCKLRHHRFVALYGISVDQGLVIISELCKESCSSAIPRLQQPGNEKLLARVCCELAEALLIMHEFYNLVHRDIKCLNVLLDKNDHVKVCDMGLARNLVQIAKSQNKSQQQLQQISQQASSAATSKKIDINEESVVIEVKKFTNLVESTLRFMAPEYFKHKAVLTKAVDVYAYGCTLLQLYTNKLPFQYEEQINKRKMADQEIRSSLFNDIIPQIPQGIPFFIKDLIERCLRPEPSKRPKMKEIFDKFESVLNDEDEFQRNFLQQSMPQQIQPKTKIMFIPDQQSKLEQSEIQLVEVEYYLNQNNMYNARLVSGQPEEIKMNQPPSNPNNVTNLNQLEISNLKRVESEEILWDGENNQQVQEQKVIAPSASNAQPVQEVQNFVDIYKQKPSTVPKLPPIEKNQHLIREVDESQIVEITMYDKQTGNSVVAKVPEIKITNQNVQYQVEFQAKNIQGQNQLQLVQLNQNLTSQNPNIAVIQERPVRSTMYTQSNNYLQPFELQPQHYSQIQQNLSQTYIGDAPGQIPNGRGRKEFPDGTVYDGEFKNGMFHGKGKCIYPDGGVYTGDFLENKRQGIGKYVWGDGSSYEGMWSNDKRGGRPIGDKGIFILANGDKYDGMFRQDKKDGIGYYTFKNGDHYEGQFKNDLINGRGKYTWANGQIFDGMFEKEKIQGFGEMTYVNGEIYKGNWKRNKREGVGILTTPDGLEMKGPWKNNFMNGKFNLEYPNGNQEAVKFSMGVRQN